MGAIAEGVATICSLVRSRQPQAFLILLTLLPVGHQPCPTRERNSRINQLLADQVDSSISHHDMFNYLDLTQKGYSKAFEPVNDLLTTLLQEMEGEVGRSEAEGCADC